MIVGVPTSNPIEDLREEKVAPDLRNHAHCWSHNAYQLLLQTYKMSHSSPPDSLNMQGSPVFLLTLRAGSSHFEIGAPKRPF